MKNNFRTLISGVLAKVSSLYATKDSVYTKDEMDGTLDDALADALADVSMIVDVVELPKKGKNNTIYRLIDSAYYVDWFDNGGIAPHPKPNYTVERINGLSEIGIPYHDEVSGQYHIYYDLKTNAVYKYENSVWNKFDCQNVSYNAHFPTKYTNEAYIVLNVSTYFYRNGWVHIASNSTSSVGYRSVAVNDHMSVASGDYSHANGGVVFDGGKMVFKTDNPLVYKLQYGDSSYHVGTRIYYNNSHDISTVIAVNRDEGTITVDKELSSPNSPVLFVGSHIASAPYSYVEGASNIASEFASHAEGYNTEASGYISHAEGWNTTASGDESHAEGWNTTASGNDSHAEGYYTTASGDSSHAEGLGTTASGYASHAEGSNTTASGDESHAEGWNTTASGNDSHAEGDETVASGSRSHAEGMNTVAASYCQHAQGRYNLADAENKYAHIVGNGEYDRLSNAHTLDWEGNAWFQGDVYVGSTSGTNRDEGSKKLATEEYVDAKVGQGGSDGTQSDWNAKEGEPGHVLNRTHYVTSNEFEWSGSPGETKPPVPGSSGVSELQGYYYTAFLTEVPETFDVCDVSFGNSAVANTVLIKTDYYRPDTVHPDSLIHIGAGNVFFLLKNLKLYICAAASYVIGSAGTVTVRNCGSVKKFSPVYIPDSIARTSQVVTGIDWAQNDATKKDYVSNRTHYPQIADWNYYGVPTFSDSGDDSYPYVVTLSTFDFLPEWLEVRIATNDYTKIKVVSSPSEIVKGTNTFYAQAAYAVGFVAAYDSENDVYVLKMYAQSATTAGIYVDVANVQALKKLDIGYLPMDEIIAAVNAATPAAEGVSF